MSTNLIAPAKATLPLLCAGVVIPNQHKFHREKEHYDALQLIFSLLKLNPHDLYSCQISSDREMKQVTVNHTVNTEAHK